MSPDVLSAVDFYTAVTDHLNRVDPAWDDGWREHLADEASRLRAALGDGDGRSALDCSCGAGAQAIPLAQLGFRVTATDLTAAYLAAAVERARLIGVPVDFDVCDMRELGARFPGRFDVVLTCMALDNITDDEGIQRALTGMHAALRPGGLLYVRLRDFDALLRDRPRYEFKAERALPHGRLLRVEDWQYEGDTHVVDAWVFLREDARWPGPDAEQGYRWQTTVFRYRRRALGRAELQRRLEAAGFADVAIQSAASHHWQPLELLARRPPEPTAASN